MSEFTRVARDIASWLVALNRTFFAWLIEPLAKVLEPHTGNIVVRNIPNAVSTGRGIVALVVSWELYHAASGATKWAWIGAVAFLILSDGFDGALARRLNIVSQFGALMDPLADKLLIGGLVIGLSFKLSSWWFGIPAILLLLIEVANAWTGIKGARKAKQVHHTEQVGASMWGKLKFGIECVLVSTSWALLSSQAVLPISVTLVILALPVASLSLRGYLQKIDRANKMLAAQSAHQLVE